MTDMTMIDRDAKLIEAVLRFGLAAHAADFAEQADVDAEYATHALARMADSWDADEPYPIIRRCDLGPDCYEAVDGVFVELIKAKWNASDA